jgi:hypothetical protein
MKKILIYVCLFIGGAISMNATAQINGLLNKTKNKTIDKINDKVKEKVNEPASTNNNTSGNFSEKNSTDKTIYDCNEISQKASIAGYLKFRLESESSNDFYGYGADKFLENAKNLDYQNLKSLLQNNLDCPANKKDIENLKDFGTTFEKDFTDNGIKGFNQIIDGAYKYIAEFNKFKDPNTRQKSFNWIDAAVTQIEAVKLILPNNKPVLDMEQEIIKAEKKIKGDVKKKESLAATSPIHLKYNNKIVFSNKPIIVGKENEADFKTSFNAGEKIYAMAYFTAGVNDLLGGAKEDNRIYASVEIDGQAVWGRGDYKQLDNNVGRQLTKTEIDKNISAWAFELIADENTTTSTIPWAFAEMLESVSPRKHTVVLNMNAWNKGGSFTIDLDGIDLEKQVQEAKAYSIKAADIIANNRTIPEEWKTYTKNSFKDPQLTLPKMKAQLKEDYNDLVEVLRIVILANNDWKEWDIVKDDILNLPKYMATPNVGIVYKAKDGKCYFTIGNFYKTYKGGGQYGSLTASCFTGGITQIGCANANK